MYYYCKGTSQVELNINKKTFIVELKRPKVDAQQKFLILHFFLTVQNKHTEITFLM